LIYQQKWHIFVLALKTQLAPYCKFQNIDRSTVKKNVGKSILGACLEIGILSERSGM
jgi:hypothetical protein